MDPDSWCTRPSPASRRYHSPSDLFHGGEDVDEPRPEFLCPFCAEDFDVVGLCCHVDEEHAVEAKNGPKRRFRKSGSNSTLSIRRKELHEGNLQPLLGGSQHLVSSSNTKPDPLLSSFMCNLPVVEPELVSTPPHSIEEAGLMKESSSEDSSHRNIHQAPLSDKEQEDRARRCEFVKGLLLSTFLDDN